MTLKGDSDEACRRAQEMLQALVADPEVGRIYRACRVTQVMPFGAFVEVCAEAGGGGAGGGRAAGLAGGS